MTENDTTIAPAPEGWNGLTRLPVGVTATATALAIPAASLTDGKQFWEIGRCLGRIEQARLWWWGDWWRAGESVYGMRRGMTMHQDWPGPTFAVCMNAASVFARSPKPHAVMRL